MPDALRCQMILKTGKRCRFQSKEGDLCGVHRRMVVGKKKYFKALITAGKVAGAVTAVVKFIQVVTPILNRVWHHGVYLQFLSYKVAKSGVPRRRHTQLVSDYYRRMIIQSSNREELIAAVDLLFDAVLRDSEETRPRSPYAQRKQRSGF